MTKCPNEMDNRALGTIGMKTIARENNGKQDNSPRDNRVPIYGRQWAVRQ